jgi:hypothetical protein
MKRDRTLFLNQIRRLSDAIVDDRIKGRTITLNLTPGLLLKAFLAWLFHEPFIIHNRRQP